MVKKAASTSKLTLKQKEIVKRRWEAGESSLSLATEFNVRDATVRTWAMRGGWIRPVKPEEKLPARLQQTSDNNELETVLSVLRAGGSVNLACKNAGIAQQTFADWLREKPELRRLVDQARAEAPVKALEALQKHAQLDHKAASYILAHHPESREDWTPHASTGKGGINVIINFNRDEPEVVIEGEAVRGE